MDFLINCYPVTHTFFEHLCVKNPGSLTKSENGVSPSGIVTSCIVARQCQAHLDSPGHEIYLKALLCYSFGWSTARFDVLRGQKKVKLQVKVRYVMSMTESGAAVVGSGKINPRLLN